MIKISNAMLQEKASRIKLIIMDTDGVLTNGQIVFTNEGDEIKSFDVQDGFGIRLAHRVGIKTAIITGRFSKVVARRAEELEIEEVHQRSLVKAETYDKLMSRYDFKHEEVAYIGDDLVDLPVMRQVGLAIAVPAATDEVKQESHYITKRAGGAGAVREVIEIILKAKDLWAQATQRYF